MKDPRDPLSSILHTWSHEPTPAPDFNAGVWSRIRSTEAAHPPSALLHFYPALPLAASIALILSVAAGASGAFALNRTRTTERMAAAYVRSIDPVQMSASSSPHAHP